MTIERIADRRYGPFPYRTCTEKIAEFAAATGDDPEIWREEAPPALAGALLFVVAPHLLGDPDAGDAARSVIHGEQTFTWHAPIPVEEELSVSGVVSRVRVRGDTTYVGFDMAAETSGGLLLTGSSLFLMSGAVHADDAPGEEAEPEPDAGSRPPPEAAALPAGGPISPIERSVSRSDLVRYAAASRDWNPIHWDHTAAVAAGLPGVVAHGLLQSAWLLQAARGGPGRVTGARFRYRAPLRPAVTAEVSGSVEAGTLALALAAPGGPTFVAATVELG
jgi:acyl dehydratase